MRTKSAYRRIGGAAARCNDADPTPPLATGGFSPGILGGFLPPARCASGPSERSKVGGDAFPSRLNAAPDERAS
jgi:hypothetical protein